MKITTITYRRLVSHSGRYGHDAFEATATVGEDESADDCADDLKHFVEIQLAERAKADRMAEERDDLERDLAPRRKELDELRAMIVEAEKVMDRYAELGRLAAREGVGKAAVELLNTDQRIPF